MRSRLARSLAALLLPVVTMAGMGCGAERAGEARAAKSEAASPRGERIVVLGGSLAETVYALGAGGRIVGADISCTYPEAALRLPKVGYQRTISAESVMALEPTMILATEEAGPPAAIVQLRDAGIRVVVVHTSDHSVEGTMRKIADVGAALGLAAEAGHLIDSTSRKVEGLRSEVARVEKQPRVLFVYTRGPGGVQISGSGTAADAMIRLAGARNAVDGYEGYKPLTAEAATMADPDVILVPAAALVSIGGVDGLLRQPGLAATRAGQARRVVAIDDLLLLGFGPRIATALESLIGELHPELKGSAS